MELTFEYSKQIGAGKDPIITHLADDTLILIFQNGNQLMCQYGDFVENNLVATQLSPPIVIANDAMPETIENIRFSGGQNWITWKSGTKQRTALFPESPYIMKPLFFKGFMAGAYSKEADEPNDDYMHNGLIDAGIANKFGVDYWNGFVVGRLIYKQLYGWEV